VPLDTTDLLAEPAPSYALRDAASWELGGPFELQANYNPATSRGDIDITLTDRRVRVMADLVVEVLLLAGGLLLGLIIERVTDLSGRRQLQPSLGPTARQDEHEPTNSGRIGRASRRLLYLIALAQALRAVVKSARRRPHD
jgi:hypothetical protein